MKLQLAHAVAGLSNLGGGPEMMDGESAAVADMTSGVRLGYL